MKICINQWDNPRISECVYVGAGDKVYAGNGSDDWGFTVGKEYEIQDVTMFGYLVMKNDDGVTEEYSTEWFRHYKPIGY